MVNCQYGRQRQIYSMKFNLKGILIVGTSFCAGVCAYAAYRYWRKRQFKSIDEGFEDVSRVSCFNGVKPKSKCFVYSWRKMQLSECWCLVCKEPARLRSLNCWLNRRWTIWRVSRRLLGFLWLPWSVTVSRLIFGKVCFYLGYWVDFLVSVGGAENYKPYWANFFEGTDLLVFVVDSADLHAMSLAVREFHGMLLDRRLAKVSILLLAHKQDLPGALTPDEVCFFCKFFQSWWRSDQK